MAGSSRSTPFPVPVYIYRSFHRSKIYRYQYRYRYRYSGFRGFSVLKLIWFNSRNNCSTGAKVKYRFSCWSIMIILHDLSCINLGLKIRVITWLVCNSEFADRMHDDRLAAAGGRGARRPLYFPVGMQKKIRSRSENFFMQSDITNRFRHAG